MRYDDPRTHTGLLVANTHRFDTVEEAEEWLEEYREHVTE